MLQWLTKTEVTINGSQNEGGHLLWELALNLKVYITWKKEKEAGHIIQLFQRNLGDFKVSYESEKET